METLALNPYQLGQILRGFRKQRGLTQTQLGEKIGLPQKDISKIETNPQGVKLEKLYLFLSALELELVFRPRDTPTNPDVDW